MPKQTQIFVNKLEKDLEVMVEVRPDHYVLKPGDEMQITYDHNGEGYGLHTIVWESGIQIYLEEFDTAVVTINGKKVEPWSQ